jgi:hypothetical protein
MSRGGEVDTPVRVKVNALDVIVLVKGRRIFST